MPAGDGPARDGDEEHRPERHDPRWAQLRIPALEGGEDELRHFGLDEGRERGAHEAEDDRECADPESYVDDGLRHPPDRQHRARVAEGADGNGPEEEARHDLRIGPLEVGQGRVEVGDEGRAAGHRVQSGIEPLEDFFRPGAGQDAE